MDQFNRLLPQIVRATAASDEVMQAAVTSAWNRAVGDGLRQYAIPMRWREQRLTVAVPDVIWQRQLNSMLGQLISRTNSILAQRLVRSIEFVIDLEVIESERQRRLTSVKPSSENPLGQELTDAATLITDPQLRRLLLDAAQTCLDRLERFGSA